MHFVLKDLCNYPKKLFICYKLLKDNLKINIVGNEGSTFGDKGYYDCSICNTISIR